MTEQELKELIAQHEADRIEFTISTKDTDKFSEAVCAFANDLPKHDRPGHLVIGVDDNGRYAGISISDQLLRNLGGLRDDGNIQPLPAISVEKIVTAQGEVAVITVQPALLPPVRYKGRVCMSDRRSKNARALTAVMTTPLTLRTSLAATSWQQSCVNTGVTSPLSVANRSALA